MADDSASFQRALEIILAHEGGLVDDPRDPGGITKFGISIRFAGSVNLDVDGDGRTTGEDIRAVTRSHASSLYHQYFWLALGCDKIGHFGLALLLFDGGVNQGVRTAARRLQRSVGAVDDGVIGPNTLAQVARHGNDVLEVLNDFAARRAKRYAETRNFSIYGRGWMRRLMDVHAAALLQ